MKFGIVLPSYIYSDYRKKLAIAAFASLMKTEQLQFETRLLLLVKAGTAGDYAGLLPGLSKAFQVTLKTDEGLVGTEQTLAFGTEWLFNNYTTEFVIWMGDDALFNPMWLWQLDALIRRHPTAKSWSVYRSAYEWFHRTLDDTGEDVSVRSICGHGLTFSKREWRDWGVTWKDVSTDPDKTTLDLLHADQRKGERWVTKKSYIQHTGKEGVHCGVDTPEYARDFEPVGEGK